MINLQKIKVGDTYNAKEFYDVLPQHFEEQHDVLDMLIDGYTNFYLETDEVDTRVDVEFTSEINNDDVNSSKMKVYYVNYEHYLKEENIKNAFTIENIRLEEGKIIDIDDIAKLALWIKFNDDLSVGLFKRCYENAGVIGHFKFDYVDDKHIKIKEIDLKVLTLLQYEISELSEEMNPIYKKILKEI